ncbi:MAG: hypothetical protein WAV09_02180 [Minisyncoccia bacterium]
MFGNESSSGIILDFSRSLGYDSVHFPLALLDDFERVNAAVVSFDQKSCASRSLSETFPFAPAQLPGVWLLPACRIKGAKDRFDHCCYHEELLVG